MKNIDSRARHEHQHSSPKSARIPQGIAQDEERITALADFFRVIGDPTRVKIILILSKGGLCVNEIARFSDMSQPAVSHQLRILKQARLVRCRREGKSIRYRLDDTHVERLIRQGISHVSEERNP